MHLGWSQDELDLGAPTRESVATDVVLLRGYADSAALLPLLRRLIAAAPLRHLQTPGGGRMSVAMSNCGRWGWHSDESGYRYVELDPLSQQPWPAMPPEFLALAAEAAAAAGFAQFAPDCCLINRYAVGAQMGTHRDFDELDMQHPIVSVSLGMPAAFCWYGAARKGTPIVLRLEDGDVLVWGRSARAGYHSVRRIREQPHPLTGSTRFNLTFRRAR